MKNLKKTISSAVLAIAVVATPMQTAAVAQGLSLSTKLGTVEPVTETAHRAKWRHRGWRLNRHRHYHPYKHHHRRYHRRHHHHHSPWPYIIGGAIIGGVIAHSAAHVRWCKNRYRSYDVYSDTYQPYYGPRRRCRSPYVH